MSSLSRRLAALAVALVVARSLVWIGWEQSHFDSDQAIFGLMAKHLAEGRAFPIFMYGQTYMLSVEAWLAAPVFLVFGASVAALKLPLLALNVFIVLALFRVLSRAGLSAVECLVSSLFFIAVPPITASRLVEAAGGNVEPLVYALLLWIARGRPFTFGLIAGLGVTHREFTWYAVMALLMLDAWSGALFTRRSLIRWGRAAAATAATMVAFARLSSFGDVLGPGTTGMSSDGLFAAGARLCVDPAASVSNLGWLFERNLSVIYGWRSEALSGFNIASRLTAGHPLALLPLGLVGVLACGAGIARVRRTAGPWTDHRDKPSNEPAASVFPLFLMIVGGLAALVYALAGCGVQDPMLIRYTLLSVFLAVGATSWLLGAVQSRLTWWVAVGAVAFWTSFSAWDHARLLVEYARQPPPSRVRPLMAHLDQSGIRFGRAPYWTAYLIDFLSDERIVLASSDVVRIHEYQVLVDRTDGPVVLVTPTPCESAMTTRIPGWCIERLSK